MSVLCSNNNDMTGTLEHNGCSPIYQLLSNGLRDLGLSFDCFK